MTSLRVLTLNCSLKGGDERSNTQVLADDVISAMRQHGSVDATTIRVADRNVPPAVSLEAGPGDDWPSIAVQILQCDVLLFATPIWGGHPSSIAQRVLERLNHYLSALDEMGRKPLYGKVAGICITGNEDGAHHVHSQIAQGLNDFGFTLPPEGSAYWTGWSDQAPSASYPDDGRDHPMTKGMIEVLGRNLWSWGRAVRELAADIPQLPSERDADGEDQAAAAQAAAARSTGHVLAHA